jgi:hypothetical protein
VKVLDDLHVKVFFKERIETNTKNAEPPFITEINIIPQAFDTDRKGLVTPAIEVEKNTVLLRGLLNPAPKPSFF